MTTSIIIPVYNQELYVGRAIRSALACKDHSDVNIIVVDDGSTDGSFEIISSFSDQIHFLQNESNKGLPYSLNRAIRYSNSKYIFRLDSDDWLHCRTIDILSFFLDNNNEIDAVASDYFLVDEKQNKLSHISSKDQPIGCSILFRSEHLISIGLYDKEQRWHEEKELMARFRKKYNLYHIPLPLYRYFRHNSNMTLDKKQMNYYEKILESKHFQ